MAAKNKIQKIKSSVVKKTKIQKKIFSKLNVQKKRLLVLVLFAGLIYIFRSSLIVAVVNNSPITRTEFNNELEKAIGKETLENLITKKLIFQEARKMEVKVLDTEIDSEIEKIKTLVEGQGTTLDLALESQGQTLDTLRENVLIQKTVEKILRDKVTVTDEEVWEYFEKNSEFYGEEVNFEELKESIRQQLTQEKLSTEFNSLIEKLKAESSITYF